MSQVLTEDARYLRMYREKPSLWIKHHIDIELARYRSREQLETWLERFPDDTHLWARKQLAAGKLVLDSSRSYQAEALDEMATPGFYAFQWANGTTKTATAALFVLWFLDNYPGGKIVTTAGTWSQLKEQLWREIPTWSSRATAPIVATPDVIDKTQINISSDWAAFGRAADRAATFEGVHAPYVAVVMDEAKAIPHEIFGAVRRILRGNPGGMFWWIALSSPGSPTGAFYDICAGDQSHRWKVFRLSAYESERVALDQLELDRQDLGETSPLFVSMNVGEFPEEGDDVVIPLSWVLAAVDRTVSEEGLKTLGVDIARFGVDESALVSLFGRRAEVSAAYQGRDTVWTEGKIHELWVEHQYARICIDDTGLVGVADHVAALGLPADGVNFAERESVQNPERYGNIKAEMYFQARSEFEAGHRDPANPDVGFSIPNDKRLIHQLAMQRYKFTLRQQYLIESHKELKARGEKSPDRADGLVLAALAQGRGIRSGLTLLPDVTPS